MVAHTIFFIGLGLYDENDLPIKAKCVLKRCDKVFAEFYTSTMTGANIETLEQSIGKKITLLNRDQTEKGDLILKAAEQSNVAFLTGGDSMTATTHIDLRIQAIKNGFKTEIIHGSSILTAVPGLLGLQHYKFGRITTLVTPEKNFFPTSPYDVIKNNKKQGLHTLILLDIQAEKNKYMTATEGIRLLITMEHQRKEDIIHHDDLICVVARAGSSNPIVKSGAISKMKILDFGPPLHTLVYPSELHFMEKKALTILSQ